jgi:hypothetical protein
MFKFIQICSAEFTTHYKFTVHSAELSANSTDNSVDFHVFKKFLFLSLIKCISIDFFRISPNFFEFCKMRQIRLPSNFLFPSNFQTLLLPHLQLLPQRCQERTMPPQSSPSSCTMTRRSCTPGSQLTAPPGAKLEATYTKRVMEHRAG